MADQGKQAIDWKVAHEHLLQIARRRAGLDLEEGRWLLAAFRAGAHVRLGYGSFTEYVERVLGYGQRLAHDKLRVAEALEALPRMPQEVANGGLSWSAARELTRVVTPATEAEWLAAARGRTVRDVERLVSGHKMGSRPQDPIDPNARRHVLRFEVSGDTLASFREAAAQLRRDSGGPLDDDSVILLMARHVLGGPKDEGRANYQVALTVCESCKQGKQDGSGEPTDVPPEVVEMAMCDPQRLETHVGRPKRSKQDIPPAVRRLVLRRDHRRCVVPGCTHGRFVDIHHIEPRAAGGAHEAENLVTLCAAHHRAAHRGLLILAGTAESLRFYHADGTEYGSVVPAPTTAEPASDLQRRHQMALQALMRLGFAQRETDAALDQAATHVGPDATAEALLRLGLDLLTSKLPRAS